MPLFEIVEGDDIKIDPGFQSPVPADGHFDIGDALKASLVLIFGIDQLSMPVVDLDGIVRIPCYCINLQGFIDPVPVRGEVVIVQFDRLVVFRDRIRTSYGQDLILVGEKRIGCDASIIPSSLDLRVSEVIPLPGSFVPSDNPQVRQELPKA